MDAFCLDQDVFGTLSSWYVVHRRRLSVRTRSVPKFSKLRDGQSATSMVLSGSINGYSES